MNHLIFVVSPYGGFVLMYIFLSQLLPRKLPYWKIALLLLPELGPQMAKIVFGSTAEGVQVFNFLLFIYGVIILPLVCFSGSIWKRLALAIFFEAVVFFVDALCYSIYTPSFGSAGELFNTPQIITYAGTTWCLYSLICLLIIWVFRLLRMQVFQPFYLLYLVFPISQGIMLYCSIYGNIHLLWLIGVILSLGAQIALLISTITQENKTELEEKLRDTRHMMALEQKHYREVEKRQEEMTHIRHDFKNQLAAVEQLIRNGEEQEAEQLVYAIGKAIKATKENPYCGIPVANAILTEKARVCAEKNIRFDSELQIPTSITVEPMLLCSIFSNLMDNAIRGAETISASERYIRLAAKMDGDYLFIKASNPSTPPSQGINNRQGYGRLILEDIAQRYNGASQHKYLDGVYSAVITLQVN